MTVARRSGKTSRLNPGHLSLAALIALSAFAAGCASAAARRSEQQPAVVSADTSRARALADQLIERDRRLDSLQTGAVMEYSGTDQKLKTPEQITVRRPSSLRVEAFSPLGVAAVVAANDTELAIFDSSRNTLTRGQANAQTLNRFVQIPLAPGPAVNLLLGLVPQNIALGGRIDSVNAEGDLVVAVYKSDDGASSEIGFAGSELAMVRERAPDGRIRYDVRYSDYRDIGGFMFAHQLDADFPLAGTHVKFRYQRPIINGATDQSMFVLNPGPGTKEIQLDRAPGRWNAG